MALLEIEDLKVYYKTRKGMVRAVDGISLDINEDEYVGLVGESGCGKTTVAKVILRILPPNGVLQGGHIVFKDRDLAQLSETQMREVRWNSISMISQSGMNALDPVKKVGDQIVEVIQLHENVEREVAAERVERLFEAVGLEPNRRDDYPHQFSGGMRQRAMIAMALVLDPWLIIADEPTTGLDVIVQDRILECISEVRRESRQAMLLVTHDMAVVAENCQRIAVMYAGKMMEYGDTTSVLQTPYCPYTMGLSNAFPSIKGAAGGRLIAIPGAPPSLISPPAGCRFYERCAFSTELCMEEEPGLRSVGPNHLAACHFLERAEEFRELAKDPAVWHMPGLEVMAKEKQVDPEAGVSRSREQAALEAQAIRKWFPLRSGLVASLLRREPPKHLKAVDGVSLRIEKGEILGLAGESGCGKSTIAMMLTKLYEPTRGDVLIDGQSMFRASSEEEREFHKQVQIIFQDPYGSLNPRYTISRTVLEPLRIYRIGNRAEQIERAKEALNLAELTPPEEFWERFPHQLSGGQRQRVAIARAIVLRPRYLVADEPVSMLDVSIRAGILDLLRRFARDLGLGVLYISHDLSTMRQICDRIAILYLGTIVERGRAATVTGDPKHPYTRALVSAIPVPDPTYRRKRVSIEGDIPDPTNIPAGCRFAPRCRLSSPRCHSDVPLLNDIEADHYVACHKISDAYSALLDKGLYHEIM
jgi:peptide/nickel transport system ATP-binding protein